MKQGGGRRRFFIGCVLTLAVLMGAGVSYVGVMIHEMQDMAPCYVIFQQARSPDGHLVAALGYDAHDALDNDYYALLRPSRSWQEMPPSGSLPSDVVARGNIGTHFSSVSWHGNNTLVIGYGDDGSDTGFEVQHTKACGVRVVYRRIPENGGG